MKQVEEGRYEVMLQDLMKLDHDELRRLYIEARQMEPAMADEMWEPEDKRFL